MEFTLTRKINASPMIIYDSWLDSNGHSRMTGGEANCSSDLGGSFTTWDGYITGKNVSLDPGKRIVQSWRTTQFKEDQVDSEIELLFTEDEEGTEITFHHRGLYDADEHYKKGWDEHYFNPMIAYFS